MVRDPGNNIGKTTMTEQFIVWQSGQVRVRLPEINNFVFVHTIVPAHD